MSGCRKCRAMTWVTNMMPVLLRMEKGNSA